jgi:DNA-binding NarL/FixJ family response regulator
LFYFYSGLKNALALKQDSFAGLGYYYLSVVIMDVHMPVITGIETTRTIKQLYPCIKVIIISSADDIPTVSAANFYSRFNSTFLCKQQNTFKSNMLHTIQRRYYYAREKAIVKLISEAYTNQQIADTLFITVSTADTHRKNILSKLKLPNTAALIRLAVQINWCRFFLSPTAETQMGLYLRRTLVLHNIMQHFNCKTFFIQTII